MNSEDLLVRLLRWVLGRVGLRNLVILALVLTALSACVFGLSSVIRGLDFGPAFLLCTAGLLLAWYLASRSLPGWAAGAACLAIGAAVVLTRIGQLEIPLVHAAQAWVGIFLQGWPWNPVPWDGFLAALERLGGPAVVLAGRLYTWLVALAGPLPAFDPIATSLAWSLAFWCAGAWAGWWTRRWGEAFSGLVPAGALLAISLNLVRGETGALLVFLGAALFLRAIASHARREQDWQARGIDFPEYLQLDFSIGSLMLVIVLVAAAVLTPSISIHKLVDGLRELAHPQAESAGRVSESLGLERQPQWEPGRFQAAARLAPGLPRSHLLRSGPELAKEVVLRIATGEVAPGSPGPLAGEPARRYYWRGLTYDRYTGRGWATSATQARVYLAGEPATPATQAGRRIVEQSVELVGSSGGENVVYAAGQLLQVDHDYRVEQRAAGSGQAPTQAGSPDIFGALLAAPAYRAISQVPEVSADALRRAGQAYPEWVQSRYLELPERVPARVLALARDLTATKSTPYDRARAIETYLRAFPYTLDLPDPPANRDVVDLFLFTLKRGYCDYYASAMVVLARAAGLPSRLVVGYAGGRYDPATARYLVTAADAHSWPEIYFPGYGWIEFEPTAGQPALERQDTTGSAGTLTPGAGEQGAANTPGRGTPLFSGRALFLWGGALLAAAGALFTLLLLLESWRLALLSPLAALQAIYREVYRRGRGLAAPARAGGTPLEYSAVLGRRLTQIAAGKRPARLIAPATGELRSLAELYSRSLYGPVPADPQARGAALRIWKRLRWRLWLAHFMSVGR